MCEREKGGREGEREREKEGETGGGERQTELGEWIFLLNSTMANIITLMLYKIKHKPLFR